MRSEILQCRHWFLLHSMLSHQSADIYNRITCKYETLIMTHKRKEYTVYLFIWSLSLHQFFHSERWALAHMGTWTIVASLHTLSKLIDFHIGFVSHTVFEAVYCFISSHRSVAVTRYRIIYLVHVTMTEQYQYQWRSTASFINFKKNHSRTKEHFILDKRENYCHISLFSS